MKTDAGWSAGRGAALLAGCALALSSASCSVGPNYVAPKPPVAASYRNASPTTQSAAADEATGATTRPSSVSALAGPTAQWWTLLHDAELNRLIDQAETANLSLRRSASRIIESRAELRMAGAKELPSINAAGQFVRLDSGQNVGLGNLGGGGSSAASSAIVTNIWTAGLDASWEIDLFGGQRRTIEAAAADFQAAVEDRRDGLVSLEAEVARDYLTLRGLQERLRIAHDNLKLQQDTLELTRSLRKAGFSSELDVSRELTQVSQTRAEIVPLTTQLSQQQHALATLLGEEPNALAGELDAAAPLPAVPAVVSIGMPADLLRRRPDIRRAERQLAAANARVGAAIADFYPKFSLTGDFGFDSTQFKSLFDWGSRYFILFPSVSWRVFDFGRTAAEVEQQRQRYQQAMLSYQDAVLSALREVEDALIAYANEQDHHAALAAAVASAQDSVAISRDQYKQGIIDFLQVLDAQRQLLSAQDELALSDQAIATNLVALYKALGGGWEEQAIRQQQEKPNADVPPAIGRSALLNGAGE